MDKLPQNLAILFADISGSAKLYENLGDAEALAREVELLRDLSRERSMNFSIIKGVKWPHALAVPTGV